MKDKLTFYLFNLAWGLLKFIPEGLGRWAFHLSAQRVYRANKKPVRQLRANLNQVTKLTGQDLEELVLKAVKSYFTYWFEVFTISNWSKQKINQKFKVLNEDRLEQYLKQEKIVLALPHMGNWDAAALWFTANYRPLTTVAEKLKPVELYEKFLKFRKAIGVEVLPLDRSIDVFSILRDRLNSGTVVALLADRDLSKTGIAVNFFGAATSMPPGPAALAWATGAVVVPLKIFYANDQQLFCELGEALRIDTNLSNQEAIKKMTQELADRFEEMIKAHPEDWHLMQKVWPTVLPIEAK